MSPEKQRIVIAEMCGWQRIPAKEPRNFADAFIQGERDAPTKVIHMLPDYLNDLNAMHEAEKILTETQWNIYGNILIEKIKPYAGPGLWNHRHIHATATQRAEAFLKTVEKWEG